MHGLPPPSIVMCVGPIRALPPARLLALADVALAVGLFAASLAYWRLHLGGASALELAAIAAATLPLAVRRRWPAGVLGVIVVARCAHLVVAPLDLLGPWLGGALVAFYSVARHRPRRSAAAVLAGASTAYLAVALVMAGERLLASGPLLAWWLAALVGDSAREHAAGLERERRQREHDAVLEERARISRELHDVVAHHLSVIVIQAGAAQTLLEDGQQVGALVSTIEDTGRQALAEMRRLLGALRGAEPDQAGPPLAPPPGLADVPALAERVGRAGLPVGVAVDGLPGNLSADLDRAAYRIVQEALTNALRHAGPARAEVRIAYLPDRIEIEVTDTGVGAASPVVHGHGIPGMRERVALHAGELDLGPGDRGGFVVRARLPLRDGAA
jgi:signal transduction histidine kinase